MTKYSYYTEECAPEKIDVVLDSCGEAGWELVNIGMVQRPTKPTLHYNPAIPQFEVKLLLIFKKVKV